MAKTAEEILQEEAETATYIDENGEKRIGTVANDYIKEALGENNYYADTAGIYGDLLNATQKENAAAAADADAATMAEIQRQTEKLNADYGKTDKQLYRDYRTAVRDLPQQLAAMGITGGLSETSRVDLERGYGENLNANTLQRLAAIRDIEAGGEAAKRQNAATLRQQNAAAAQNFLQQLIGLGSQKFADEQAKAQQGAALRAENGDFGGYVEIGLMTEEQAAQLQKAWIKANPALAKALGYVKASSGGYSGPGGDGGDGYDDLTPVQQYIAVRAAEEVVNGNSDWINSFEKNDDFSSEDKAAATAYLKKEGIL